MCDVSTTQAMYLEACFHILTIFYLKFNLENRYEENIARTEYKRHAEQMNITVHHDGKKKQSDNPFTSVHKKKQSGNP